MTSDEFRTIRLQLGLTQAELGAIMGIAQKNISRLETGDREPTKIQAAFISHLAGCKSTVSVDDPENAL